MIFNKEKFLSKIKKTDSCWIYLKCLNENGYGRFIVNQKFYYAHRVSFSLFKGPLINGLVVDHICNNPSCVNPDHLQQITQRENSLRGRSIFAKNYKKTHCKRGHVFDEKNTIYVQKGRRCRICHNKTKRESWRRCGKKKDLRWGADNPAK